MKNSSAKLDMLSDLPDVLLLRIISLASLGARTLVQTSLFSRRWRHLWRDVRRLDIDPREFQLQDAAAATTHHNKRGKRDPVKEWDRFERFADSLLSHRSADVPLDALRLHVANPPQGQGQRSQPDGGRWVRRCLERCCPPELDIRGCFETLVDIRCLGRGIDLGRLTTLRLRGVVLRRHHLEIGASVCPRLEHLELEDCDMGFTEVVASSTLKSLVVSHTSEGFYNSRDEFRTPRPRIEAPDLASLRLTLDYPYARMLLAYEVPSLVEACVRLINRGIIDNEFELLHSLYNVTKLELFGFSSLEQLMHRVEQDLPKFDNLTTLVLDRCNLTGKVHTTLDLFLQNAPKLENITLQYCKLPGGSKRMTGGSKSKMPSKYLNLKFVEIKYRKQDGVSETVDLLLDVSKNLQRSSILLSKTQ